MENQTLVSRYEIQQQLSKKAGRQTLLARDLQTQQLVVIKLLTFGTDFAWDDLKLFEREATTLQSLSHPAIPQYLDYLELDGDSGKKLAIVQTYIAAQSLEQHLKAGRTFSETEIKEIAKALLEILTYLHGRTPPVIHRDIKPSNILLANRSAHSVGQVYLVDFGSVQTLAAQQGGNVTVVGTYGYMPPEQFGGRAVPASDIYSLGATLIYLVTGTHPADLPQKDLKIQFQPPANISQEVKNWLQMMTDPSLERRLANAQDALSALENPQPQQLGNSEPTVVYRAGTSEILLTKNANSLSITVPLFTEKKLILTLRWVKFLQTGFISLTLGSIWCLIIYCLIVMYPGFLRAILLIIRMLFMTLFVTTIAFISYQRAKISNKKARFIFTFDRQEMTIQLKIPGWWSFFEAVGGNNSIISIHDINDINKLELLYQDSSSHPYQINIWRVGNTKWKLQPNPLIINQVTGVELDWVASEISQWLGLPLETKVLPAK